MKCVSIVSCRPRIQSTVFPTDGVNIRKRVDILKGFPAGDEVLCGSARRRIQAVVIKGDMREVGAVHLFLDSQKKRL